MLALFRQFPLSATAFVALMAAVSNAMAQSCAGDGAGGALVIGDGRTYRCVENLKGDYERILVESGARRAGESIVGNAGTIGSLDIAAGAQIDAQSARFLGNGGIVQMLVNRGDLSIPVFIDNGERGNIWYIYNEGRITRGGILNFGEIGNIFNRGVYQASETYIDNRANARIGRIENSSLIDITASQPAIFNQGAIGVFLNSSEIRGNGHAIINEGRIQRLTNNGTINSVSNTSSGYIVLLDNFGTIGRVVNNGLIESMENGGHLIMQNRLPLNYTIYIESRTRYGRLVYDASTFAPVGTMRFSLQFAQAIKKNPEDGTYARVIEGVPAENLYAGTLEGRYRNRRWRLEDPDGDLNWDLVLWTPQGAPRYVDPDNTLAMLQQSAAQVRGQISQQQASLVAILNYDSNVFGNENLSVSFLGRYTALIGETSQGAGGLVAAYRINSNLRLGAFVDYAPWYANPSNMRQSSTQPTFGAFAVYEERPDLVGWNGRLSFGYGQSLLTVTRPAALDDTEAGSGKSTLSGFGAAGEISYGVRVGASLVALPYVGLRYTDVSRSSYAEWQTQSVAFPITYSTYAQRLTTATVGVRLSGSFNPQFGYFVGAGVEYDIGQNMGRYRGSSAIEGLETFSFTTDSYANRLRATGAVGISYVPAQNQKLTAEVGLWQQAFSANPVFNTVVKYSVGF
ncbi:autotransporter domain-containing protein [Rhizobiales bacterium TNE-4]|nr:autotransporter domain-containing protein [Rhizobiales bacterium TNE-4]MBV1828787.1 autotransporter domain-containing protein [Rhizobiales bacterium TNE-4]